MITCLIPVTVWHLTEVITTGPRKAHQVAWSMVGENPAVLLWSLNALDETLSHWAFSKKNQMLKRPIFIRKWKWTLRRIMCFFASARSAAQFCFLRTRGPFLTHVNLFHFFYWLTWVTYDSARYWCRFLNIRYPWGQVVLLPRVPTASLLESTARSHSS